MEKLNTAEEAKKWSKNVKVEWTQTGESRNIFFQ